MWKIFWFEGNQAFGMVDSPEAWERIRNAYALRSGYIDLKNARYCEGSGDEGNVPNFGFYGEHQGALLLWQWAKRHNMYEALFGNEEVA